MRRLIAAIGLVDRNPAQATDTADTTPVVPPAGREQYTGRHRHPGQTDWRPAHTPAAAHRRGRHTQPDGLDLDRIQKILAADDPTGLLPTEVTL